MNTIAVPSLSPKTGLENSLQEVPNLREPRVKKRARRMIKTMSTTLPTLAPTMMPSSVPAAKTREGQTRRRGEGGGL